jgi:hypothetical protein
MKNWKILLGLLVIILPVAFIACSSREEANAPRNIHLGNFSQKTECIMLYRPIGNNRQNIYILGTIHGGHFDEKYNYSMADVQNVIDVIHPDIILVEIRSETFEKYGVLDGPFEMTFAWCYAEEKGIETRGIDWWTPAVGLPLTLPAIRDDHIFDNIISASSNKKNILVLIGASHLFPLDKRFTSNKYRRIKIENKENYFYKSGEISFHFPEKYEIERRKNEKYYGTQFLEEIYGLPEDSPYREAWMRHLLGPLYEIYQKHGKDILTRLIRDFIDFEIKDMEYFIKKVESEFESEVVQDIIKALGS